MALLLNADGRARLVMDAELATLLMTENGRLVVVSSVHVVPSVLQNIFKVPPRSPVELATSARSTLRVPALTPVKSMKKSAAVEVVLLLVPVERKAMLLDPVAGFFCTPAVLPVTKTVVAVTAVAAGTVPLLEPMIFQRVSPATDPPKLFDHVEMALNVSV